MIRNYLKITLRQLWRNRLFTILNIVGLSIGISTTCIIYRIVSYEYSFNTKIPEKERIYRVVSRFSNAGKESGNAGIPLPLPEAIKTQVIGVERVVPFFEQYFQKVTISQSGKVILEEDYEDRIPRTTSNYFAVFPYKWLIGNEKTALNAPNQIVLTQKKAEIYFPNIPFSKMLGQTVTFEDSLKFTVSGVVKDLDFPSDLSKQAFISFTKIPFSSNNWGGVSSQNHLFFKVLPNVNLQKIEKQINEISLKNSAEQMKHWGGSFSRRHLIIPLSEIHFATEYSDNNHKADKVILNILMGIALFLLLLAVINYINIATAQLPQRAKEIGIRKTLGSSRWTLIFRFLGETFLLVMIAFGFSLVLSDLFFRTFDFATPIGMSQYVDYQSIIIFVVCFVIFVTLLTGFYPSWIITKFQPIKILKGEYLNTSNVGLLSMRKGLIIFQFFVANIFIVGTLMVEKQLKFLLQENLGFNKEAVITVGIPYKLLKDSVYKNRQFVLKEALKKLKEVKEVSLGNPLLSNSFSSNHHSYTNSKGEKIERNIYRKYADADMSKVYDLPLLAGKNLLSTKEMSEYVINKTAVKEFGFRSPQEAIGKYLNENGNANSVQIVGVVDDFHSASFHQKIEPIAFMTAKENLDCFNIKLSSNNPKDWAEDIKNIKKTWSSFYPAEKFEAKYYDDVINELYKSEREMAQIINLATFVTILISCLGLFGLATFTAESRTKEIGIRKVLGASVMNITTLLSKDFIKLVLVSTIIASPIAYYLIHQWLGGFAYKTDLHWWVFALAGIILMLIALLTVSYQAIKAALMNPVKSLKTE